MAVEKFVVLEKLLCMNKQVVFLKNKGYDNEAISYKIVTIDSGQIFKG